MRNVLLIAVSFVREQRWPIFVLLLWVVGLCLIGLTIDLRKSREDVLIIFKQLAVYGVAFAVFFGGSAIHNDRRSRRILAVLSKAVGRKQYLCGLLTGIALALSLYCFCMGFTGSWVLGAGRVFDLPSLVLDALFYGGESALGGRRRSVLHLLEPPVRDTRNRVIHRHSGIDHVTVRREVGLRHSRCTRSSVPCSTRHSARRGISSGRY